MTRPLLVLLALFAALSLAATPAPRPLKRVEAGSSNVAVYSDGGSIGIYFQSAPGRH